MGILSKLFGAGGDGWKPRPFFKNSTPEQARDWFAHVPPWSDLDARLQDMYISRLMGNQVFEVFVHVSMEQGLVSQYRDLARLIPLGVPAAVYAHTAAILCTAGARSREEFVRLLPSARGNVDKVGVHYSAALNAFEAALHVEPEFSVAYGEMAVTLMVLQKRQQAAEWCKRALAVVAKQKQAPLPSSPGMDLAGSIKEHEQHLRQLLAEIEHA